MINTKTIETFDNVHPSICIRDCFNCLNNGKYEGEAINTVLKAKMDDDLKYHFNVHEDYYVGVMEVRHSESKELIRVPIHHNFPCLPLADHGVLNTDKYSIEDIYVLVNIFNKRFNNFIMDLI